MSDNGKISIIILGNEDSLKNALKTKILEQDSSAPSQTKTRELERYESDTYEVICPLNNKTALEEIKMLVKEKCTDMCLLALEDGFSKEKIWHQINELNKTTGIPRERFIVVLPLSHTDTDHSFSSLKLYTVEEVCNEVSKLTGDKDPQPTNKRKLDSPQDTRVNLVLVGMSGTGKSASGNTILGADYFDSRPSSNQVTRECQLVETEILNGARVRVIDMPDIFDDDISASVRDEHVKKCKELCQSEPCVYLLVMQVGRFTDCERDILKKFEKAFDSRVREQTIILFTCGEELQQAGVSLEEFLESCQPDLREIVHRCDKRRVVFSNKPSDHQSSDQVAKLMQTVDKILGTQRR